MSTSHEVKFPYLASCAIATLSQCSRTIFLVWLLLCHLSLNWHPLLCHIKNEPLVFVFEGFDSHSHLSCAIKRSALTLGSLCCPLLLPAMELDVQTRYSALPSGLPGTVINFHVKTKPLSSTSILRKSTLKHSKFDKTSAVREKKLNTVINSAASLFPSRGAAYVLPEVGMYRCGETQRVVLFVQLHAQQHFAP